jgi:sensor histidine kinase YesM
MQPSTTIKESFDSNLETEKSSERKSILPLVSVPADPLVLVFNFFYIWTMNLVRKLWPKGGAPPTVVIDDTPSSCQKCLVYCGVTFVVLFFLGLCGAGITYVVFAIKGLASISHNTIQNSCSSSDIWVFVLVALILGFMSAKTVVDQSKGEDIASKMFATFIQFLLTLGLGIWGATQVYSECAKQKLSHLLIYTIAKIQTWLYLGSAIFCFLVILSVLLWVCIQDSRDEAKQKKMNRPVTDIGSLGV